MAIQDSDPERRNLVVTSLAFIVFFAADGQVAQDIIKLQIVPVTFKNTSVLGYFVWSILIWFSLRYWQTHRTSYKDAYQNHITEFDQTNNGGAKYIEKALKIPEFPSNNGFRSNKLCWQGHGPTLHIKYQVVEEFEQQNNGSYSIKKQTPEVAYPLCGPYGYMFKIKYFFSFAIKTPGFTSYAVPYILFALALLSPLLSCKGS